MHVPVRLYAATISDDTSFLVRFICFMIPIQRYCSKLVIWTHRSHQNRTRITYVRAKDFCSNNQYRYTSTTTEPEIYFWVANKCILDLNKATCKLLFNFCWINHALCNFRLVKSIFNRLFNVKAQLRFYKLWDFFAKNSMTICNSKEVSPPVFS